MTRWRPTASAEGLRRRADLLAQLRAFFAERGVMEVSTPVLTAGITDLHIDSLQRAAHSPPERHAAWLRTSPEYAHKRLLAAGCGDLYELGPVFRAGERGHSHRQEFTLLEWYRVGWTWQQLATEVLALIEQCSVLTARTWTVRWMAWSQAFEQHVQIDPWQITDAELQALTADLPSDCNRSARLDWLWSRAIQSHFPHDQLTVIHHYPATQAALAKLDPEQPHCALRFEVFAGAVELANGYQELTDANEQRQRLMADNTARQAHGKPTMPIDERLLAALQHGLPDCAGVALGIERLLMVLTGTDDIADVMAFADG
jgi:lysyl-tRNA synthetase class 2